jgi:hypothetical protein
MYRVKSIGKLEDCLNAAKICIRVLAKGEALVTEQFPDLFGYCEKRDRHLAKGEALVTEQSPNVFGYCEIK